MKFKEKALYTHTTERPLLPIFAQNGNVDIHMLTDTPPPPASLFRV